MGRVNQGCGLKRRQKKFAAHRLTGCERCDASLPSNGRAEQGRFRSRKPLRVGKAWPFGPRAKRPSKLGSFIEPWRPGRRPMCGRDVPNQTRRTAMKTQLLFATSMLAVSLLSIQSASAASASAYDPSTGRTTTSTGNRRLACRHGHRARRQIHHDGAWQACTGHLCRRWRWWLEACQSAAQASGGWHLGARRQWRLEALQPPAKTPGRPDRHLGRRRQRRLEALQSSA